MGKKSFSRLLLTAIFINLLTLTMFNVGLVKADTFYYNFKITVTPESPTTYDEVNVTVSFETASFSYVVIFSPLLQVDNDFFVTVNIYVPDVVVFVIGYVEETYPLGKLSEGTYTFNVNVQVWDYETGALLEQASYGKSFTIISPIVAFVDIDPDTLSLKGEGKWITAYIELQEGYNVSDIDIETILLNGTISVDSEAPTKVDDHDKDDVQDLMVKFDRVEVEAILNVGNVTLTLTGKVNGRPFEGKDIIKVIDEEVSLVFSLVFKY